MSQDQAEYKADQPRRIVTEISGFTPIFDAMVNVYHDETIAAVFGAIWRYCQMEDGVCRASLDTIGGAIGVDKATVMRHAQTLCADGYLKDLTPDLRNRPHVYAETGRIVMTSRIDGVAQRNVGIAQSNSRVAQRNAGVAESKLSKDFNKDSIKDIKTTTTTANNFNLYESNIGPLTPIISDTLNDMEITYSAAWVGKAIVETAKSNVRNIKYVEAVLKGYKERGSPDIGRDKVKPQRTTRTAPMQTDDVIKRMAQDAARNRHR